MTLSAFDRLTGPALIVSAAILGVSTLIEWTPDFATEFRDGDTQIALEDSLNKVVPIRDLSVSGWNGLRYGLFGEMLEGGIAGRSGWLFTSEEYSEPDDYEVRFQQNIDILISNAKSLEAMGTKVTIAIVPDKSRIVAEYTRHPKSKWLEDRYDAILHVLTDSGIRAIDLRPALVAIGHEGFLAQDTHWSAAGAKTAADAIASAIGPHGEATFNTVQTSTISYTGDLTNFVGAGLFAENLGLGPVNIPQFVTTEILAKQDADFALFGDERKITGAVVGTSYSAVLHWNFLGALKEALSADILDHSVEGKGPFVPMKDYISNLRKEDAPEFLIWEVPERYLTVTPKNI